MLDWLRNILTPENFAPVLLAVGALSTGFAGFFLNKARKDPQPILTPDQILQNLVAAQKSTEAQFGENLTTIKAIAATQGSALGFSASMVSLLTAIERHLDKIADEAIRGRK